MKLGVSVDRNGKMSLLSIKRGVFMDGIYLYDVDENIN